MAVVVQKVDLVGLVQEVHRSKIRASVQLSLLGDSISCSASPELCITVEIGEEEIVVVTSHSDLPLHNTMLVLAKFSKFRSQHKSKTKLP